MRCTFIPLHTVLIGILAGSFLFSGCASKNTKIEASGTRSVDGQTVQLSKDQNAKAKKPKEDFIIGFNPFKDDPDNPSPHNPLVKKFGDIPQVRTYIRLQRKYLSGKPLTIDEAIDLHAAEHHLYQWQPTKARLQSKGLSALPAIIDSVSCAAEVSPIALTNVSDEVLGCPFIAIS